MLTDDIIDFLESIDARDLRWELKKLRAIREWALGQAGIDYRDGDQVRITDGYTVSKYNMDGSYNGLWHYRECLTGGATGTAVRIDFSPNSMTWVTDFRPDREWSVTEDRNGTIRYWHGSLSDTPEGYKPPSAYYTDNYPDGRKHIFMMRSSNLVAVRSREI